MQSWWAAPGFWCLRLLVCSVRLRMGAEGGNCPWLAGTTTDSPCGLPACAAVVSGDKPYRRVWEPGWRWATGVVVVVCAGREHPVVRAGWGAPMYPRALPDFGPCGGVFAGQLTHIYHRSSTAWVLVRTDSPGGPPAWAGVIGVLSWGKRLPATLG